MSFDRIVVLGAGSWGTALANVTTRTGRKVTLWARDAKAAAAIARTRESPRLAGIKLAPSVEVTDDIAVAKDADMALIAVPAQALREASLLLEPVLPSGTPVVTCSKGIERGSHKFMTEVIAECVQTALPAILSGPSFASDVARGLPTAVTLAARDLDLAERLAQAIGSATFRLYHSSDVRGVEIGGAAKNVLAIAAGIVAGRGLGASAAAALTTRGFAELFRFGRAFGARPETLTGLSGLGDLALTCSTAQSRNYSFGVALGMGEKPQEAAHGRLAEGASTAQALVELARARQIEMPIAFAISSVLDGSMSIDAAIESLLTRPFREE
jgi:glycerol-3-phosphate dehydrogenase (NAD(P)+)